MAPMDSIPADLVRACETNGTKWIHDWHQAILDDEGERALNLAERIVMMVCLLGNLVDDASWDEEEEADADVAALSVITQTPELAGDKATEFVHRHYAEEDWDEISRALADVEEAIGLYFGRLLPRLTKRLDGDAPGDMADAALLFELSREGQHIAYHLEEDFIERWKVAGC